MGKKTGFGRINEERKSLSFFKIFQSADLSSESMRAIPYDFVRNIPEKDFCYKMVIRAKWGSSWEVEISKNPRFYYMEKLGWNQFVSDNALGENEFVTFTHRGKMLYNVNIYEQHGREIVRPRKPLSMASTSRSKKVQADKIYKDVKKEEETCESMGGIGPQVKKKETETSKKKIKIKSKSKKVANDVETGESMGGVEIKARKKKAEESYKKKSKSKSKEVVNDVESKSSKKKKKKKMKMESKKVVNGIPEFTLTIKNSYVRFLAVPKDFAEDYIPTQSKMFTFHHPNGSGSWTALCLVRETRTIFSRGWSKLAREYPLMVGDIVTFKLVEPTVFILVVYKKAKEEICAP